MPSKSRSLQHLWHNRVTEFGADTVVTALLYLIEWVPNFQHPCSKAGLLTDTTLRSASHNAIAASLHPTLLVIVQYPVREVVDKGLMYLIILATVAMVTIIQVVVVVDLLGNLLLIVEKVVRVAQG